MITLDASVFIALDNPADAHHARAAEFFKHNVDELLYVSELTHAEVLVHPAQQGAEEQAFMKIANLGVTVLGLPPDGGVWLAQLRARTGLKLPDCCVILAAQTSDSRIATFDTALAREAERLGIAVASI